MLSRARRLSIRRGPSGGRGGKGTNRFAHDHSRRAGRERKPLRREGSLRRALRKEDSLSGLVYSMMGTPISQRQKPLLRLSSAALCVPRRDKPDGGEDAVLVSDCNRVVAVADGVGGWARVGVDAGQYARELMDNVGLYAARGGPRVDGNWGSPGCLLEVPTCVTPARPPQRRRSYHASRLSQHTT